MSGLFRSFDANARGRDLAVGDVHGHFSRLRAALDAVAFDARVDRLFSVGDLVDRGPESEQVLDWLAQPWFHAVLGNHEEMAVRYAAGNPMDQANYRFNGGGWFIDLPAARRQEIADALGRLPYAIEVWTPQGPVGLCHADCPVDDWADLPQALARHGPVRQRVLWSRARLEGGHGADVRGVRAVAVGHTPVSSPTVLGNVWHIDTGGWLADASGRFTLLDLVTLQTAAAAARA